MSTSRFLLFALLLACLLMCSAQAGPAATPDQNTDPDAWCRTGTTQEAISTARHLFFQRRPPRALPAKSTHVYRSGKVAVFRDDGQLVMGPRRFDLAHRGLQFLRRETGYRTVRSAKPLFTAIGERIEIGNYDSVEIALPGWEFPFYGETYSRVYVNSDGNLTFGAPAPWVAGSLDRDLGDFLDGPPGIAPLYTVLEPGSTSGEDGVFVNVLPTRLRVTWLRVPKRDLTGQNSFQVTIFQNGRIQILYGDVDAQVAVVGITPGGGDPRLELLDLDVDPPYPPLGGTIAESFSFQHEYDELGLANMFCEHFQDVYDLIIVYLDFPHALLEGRAGAYYLTLKNPDRGIGRGIYDFSDVAGSDGRLQGIVHMGMTDYYPPDPDADMWQIFTPMTLLAHEVGHRWLANARFRTAAGVLSDDLRDAEIRSHWSFFHDTQGSAMMGNYIQDNGDGTFTTYDGEMRYSDLDLYLMGMLPPEQVSDFFYVANADFTPLWNRPLAGVTMTGDRVDVDVGDVIRAEGVRNPPYAAAQRHFNMAFVLLTADGAPPRPESLAKLQRMRRRWMTYFPEATRGEARVGTALRPR